MLDLNHRLWTRLYKEVLQIALAMTRTSNPKLAFTQRDRAQEAVQRACLRYLRLRPDLASIDAVRDYLVGATRSELGNPQARAKTRQEIEQKAIVEEATLSRVAAGTSLSVETLHLDRNQGVDDAKRAARMLGALTARLASAGDTVALGTLKCIGRGVIEPEHQARELGCAVEEIYNARKRRKRVMQQVLTEYARDVSEPSEPEVSGRGGVS